MRAFYSEKPAAFVANGDNSYMYHWDVVRIEAAGDGERTGGSGSWQTEEVQVYAPLTANKVLEAVIEEEYPKSREQKLVNDYNAVALGVATGDDAKEKTAAYTAFLERRKALKECVDADCKEFGIE